MALQLRRKGITRVHPLQGGLAAWMALHFPVQQLQLPGTQESEKGHASAGRAHLRQQGQTVPPLPSRAKETSQ